MNKIFKKAICVFLAVLMLFAVTIPAFAEDVDKTPVIVIPGVLNTPIIRNDTGEQVLLPDFTNMSTEEYEEVLNTLKYILKLQDTGDYNGATKKLINLLYDVLGGAAMNADGTSKYPTHVIKNYDNYNSDSSATESIGRTIAKKIGNENVYVFTYDWRGEVIGIVDNELAPFVEKIKKDTGSDKVKIVCVSMGGAVTSTYLARYGYRDDVKKVVFVSSAATGVEFVNSLLSKDITVVRSAIGPYFKALADFPIPSAASAVSGYLTQIIGKMLDSQLDTLWNEFLQPFCLKFPAVWELAEHTKDVDRYLEEYNVNPTLKEKVKSYYRIQDNYNDTLDALQEKGVEICFTSNYNLIGVPLTSKAMVTNSDFLIAARQTSNGATVADLFKTLPDNYTQKNDDGHNHISEDKIVDASTCYSPEKTWFMKNLVHAIFGDDDCYTEFVAWLAVNNDTTIETDPNYPQFMRYNRGDNTLTPVQKVVIENPDDGGTGAYCSSAITTYTYTQITALGWAVIIACAVLVVLLIAKKSGNKEPIEGVLTKAEIKALPKGERKAAKKQNKARIKEWKKEQKAKKKARKAELKAMPKAERKAAKKADKKEKKARKKELKAQSKAAKRQKKIDKKARKAEKKAK